MNNVNASNLNANSLTSYGDLNVNGTAYLNGFNASGSGSVGTLEVTGDFKVDGYSTLSNVSASSISTGSFQMSNGASDGYVLTCDGSGNASWGQITSASFYWEQTYKSGNTSVVAGVVRNTGWRSGSNNAFLGNYVADNLTSGSLNTGLGGEGVLKSTTTGNENVGIGPHSLPTNITGSRNIGIGSHADVLSSDLENATAIGANAKVGVKNGIVLGDSNSALVGIGTGYPTARLDVRGSFKLVDGTEGAGKVLVSDQNGNASWTNLPEATIASNFTKSDSTLKTNIKPTTYGLAALMQLRPVNFTWKENGSNDIGFIAQEMKLVVPELVHGNQGSYSISYGQLSAVITQAVQEQQKVIEAQQVAINALMQKVEQLSLQLNQKK